MAAALVAQSIAMAVAPTIALAATNAPCDILQTQNSWVYRENSTPIAAPYANYVFAQLNYSSYYLCTPGQPIQSASSAWIAVEGPGNSDIVQVGQVECNGNAAVCGNGMDEWIVDYFYAWGVSGDPFKQPWPNKISRATIDANIHAFSMDLQNGNWEFRIDGVLKKTISDSWRSWHAIKAVQSVEVLNQGDEMGAGVGHTPSKQKFRSGLYRVGSTYYYGWTNVIGPTGHCYPWASWTKIDGRSWDVWTNNNHTGC